MWIWIDSILCLQVTRVDHIKKRVQWSSSSSGAGGGKEEEKHWLDYDMLINSSPIDQFVAHNNICAPLRLEHNKASGEFVFLTKKSGENNMETPLIH
jgi:hypothetical protein